LKFSSLEEETESLEEAKLLREETIIRRGQVVGVIKPSIDVLINYSNDDYEQIIASEGFVEPCKRFENIDFEVCKRRVAHEGLVSRLCKRLVAREELILELLQVLTKLGEESLSKLKFEIPICMQPF